MAALTRYTQKIFGSSAGSNQLAEFGSFNAGSPNRYDGSTITPTIVQTLSNYLTGLFGSVIGSDSPFIEDINSLFYLLSYQLAYLMERGVPEWDSGTTYYTGDIVNSAGTLYSSLADSNTAAITDVTKWVSITGAPSRNLIINGLMDFDQRHGGTLQTGFASGGFIVDRFKYLQVTTGMGTPFAQSARGLIADVPTLSQLGVGANYSFTLACTTAGSAIGGGQAGAYASASYYIEGPDYGLIAGQAVTLTFWVKAHRTGTYCVAFQNNGADRSYVVEYTVSVADTWEKKTVQLTLNQTGGTESYVEGTVGLAIIWCQASGSTFQTTANAWQSGNYFATSNQVNALLATTDKFQLTAVKLNLGAPGGFTRAGGTIAGELDMAQRYYEKSYEIQLNIGNASTKGMFATIASAAGAGAGSVQFKVRKCQDPGTLHTYDTVTGTADKIHDVVGNTGLTVTYTGTGQSGFAFTYTGGNNASQEQCQWIADAEL